jgi:hypothetical protein
LGYIQYPIRRAVANLDGAKPGLLYAIVHLPYVLRGLACHNALNLSSASGITTMTVKLFILNDSNTEEITH